MIEPKVYMGKLASFDVYKDITTNSLVGPPKHGMHGENMWMYEHVHLAMSCNANMDEFYII